MRWLQLAELLELHRRLIEQSGGLPGLRDLGLLEASLALPRQVPQPIVHGSPPVSGSG